MYIHQLFNIQLISDVKLQIDTILQTKNRESFRLSYQKSLINPVD